MTVALFTCLVLIVGLCLMLLWIHREADGFRLAARAAPMNALVFAHTLLTKNGVRYEISFSQDDDAHVRWQVWDAERALLIEVGLTDEVEGVTSPFVEGVTTDRPMAEIQALTEVALRRPASPVVMS